jgi:hypothetical protein
VPTTANPDSKTVMPAATTSSGCVPSGSTPIVNRAAVAPVARNPPITCRKNAGNRCRAKKRPVTSMTAVIPAADSTATAGAPSSSASDPASPAAPVVATQRG